MSAARARARHPASTTWGIDTLAVHAAAEPDTFSGAISPPIYQTSTYAQDGVGRPRRGFEYARTQNPTRERLERAVAALEGADRGIAFASGSAATAAISELVASGEEVIAGDDVYGGTYRYFETIARPRGIDVRYVDLAADPRTALASSLSPRTRLVWFETPTNPLLKIIDIETVAAVAHAHVGARGRRPVVVVDNTFASPVVQRPLGLGADVVLHSATKYLGGHGDVVSGVVVTSDRAIAGRLRFVQNAVGAVPGPLDCWLVLRGLRTLALRSERQAANATSIARFLAGRDDVGSVLYPGLGRDSRPATADTSLVERQMRSSGGMLSFIPKAGGRHGRTAEERAVVIAGSTRIFTLAESLGGVESLIEIPAVMTHASVAGSPLAVPAALVRVSVGIESAGDLVEDLRRALDEA